MKRIHYLLLGLLVSLTIAAVSPGLPPTRIAPGSGIAITTNGVNNFTIANSVSSTNTPILSGTNVWTGTNTFNARVVMGGAGTIYGGLADLLLTTADGAVLSYGSGGSRGSLTVAPLVSYTYGAAEAMRITISGVFSVGTPGNGARTAFTQIGATNVLKIANYAHADGSAIELLEMTAPAAPSAGSVRLYATNVAGTARLYGMAEDGTSFLLTPHMKDSPGNAADGADPDPVVFHESNAFLGRERFIHLTAAVREIERLSGKKFIFDRDIPKKDWEESQTKNKKMHDQRRADAEADLKAWQEDLSGTKGPRPNVPPPFKTKPNPFKRD